MGETSGRRFDCFQPFGSFGRHSGFHKSYHIDRAKLTGGILFERRCAVEWRLLRRILRSNKSNWSVTSRSELDFSPHARISFYFCFPTDTMNRSQPNSTRVDLKNHFVYLMSDIDSFLATVSAILLFLLVTCMCFTVQFAERKHKYHKAVTTMDKHSNSMRTHQYFNHRRNYGEYTRRVYSHTNTYLLKNIYFYFFFLLTP